MRIPFAALTLALLAIPALAASPKVEAAIKTLRAAAADPNQQKTFCALLAIDDEKKGDPNAKAAIDGYVKQLGSEFQTAWNTGDSLDENTADAKALYAAIDELSAKCK